MFSLLGGFIWILSSLNFNHIQWSLLWDLYSTMSLHHNNLLLSQLLIIFDFYDFSTSPPLPKKIHFSGILLREGMASLKRQQPGSISPLAIFDITNQAVMGPSEDNFSGLIYLCGKPVFVSWKMSIWRLEGAKRSPTSGYFCSPG